MKKKPFIFYHGQKINNNLGINWKDFSKQTIIDKAINLQDFFYIDKNGNCQIRTEIWNTEIKDEWFLINVKGVEDNINEGECLSINWTRNMFLK